MKRWERRRADVDDDRRDKEVPAAGGLDLTRGRDDPPGGGTGGGEDDRQGEGKRATIGGGEVESVRPRRSR